MDMTSTLMLRAALTGGVNTGTGTETPLTDIQAGDDTLSFKSVMSGLISGQTDVTGETAENPTSDVTVQTAVCTEETTSDIPDSVKNLSILTAGGKMLSVGNETALKYFVGTYLSSKNDSTESNNVFGALLSESENGDYSDVWDKLLSALSANDITGLSAFTAEMETFLFTGETGKKDRSLGGSLADIFDDMELRIEAAKAKRDPQTDVAALLASLAAAPVYAQDSISYDTETVMTEEDTEALVSLLENSPDETIRDLAKELTSVFSSRLSEVTNETADTLRTFVNALEASPESIASYSNEDTVLGKVIQKLKALSAKADVSEISYTETPAAKTTETKDGKSLVSQMEAMAGAGQAKIKAAEKNVSETELPKIEAPVKEKDVSSEPKPDKELLFSEEPPKTPVTVQTAEEKVKFTEEMNFKTMEQVISEIEKNVKSFSGTKELTVKLTPESLGEITVKLTKNSDGTLDVSLAAQSRDVSELLRENSSQLASALADKGADVRSMNIVEASQSNQNLSFNMNGEQGYEQYQNRTAYAASGARNASDDDDGDDMSVSGINDTADIISSREAKLWMKI